MKKVFKIRKGFSILLSIFISFSLYAQSPNHTIGDWFMLFNQTRLHNKWSIHAEIQYRSFEIAPNTEQVLLRGGFNYHLNKSAFASAGYAYIGNYAFDKELLEGIQVSENRIWQQFLMRNAIGRVVFEHRYRLEQRWLHTKNKDRYLDRVRYLLRVSIPLNKKEIEKNALFLSFYDELFIHFTSTPFDRNRLYGAIGYQFMPNANVQLGWLAQTVNNTTKQYLQIAINYNIDFRKKEK